MKTYKHFGTARNLLGATPRGVYVGDQHRWAGMNMLGGQVLAEFAFGMASLPQCTEHDRLWQLRRIDTETWSMMCKLSRGFEDWSAAHLFATEAEAREHFEADRGRMLADGRWIAR